jgi:hypothetical protein
MSAIESVANTALGFAISVAIGAIVYRHFGLDVSLSTNIQITAVFTVISVARSYAVRRFFNGAWR